MDQNDHIGRYANVFDDEEWDTAKKLYHTRSMGQILREISGLRNIRSVVEYMQKDRNMLWNTEPLVGTEKEAAKGSIEFRGGRCSRGPVRTKRWVAFTVGLIELLLCKVCAIHHICFTS
jgi:hypothetical protein